MHATLQPALSVSWSVGWSVGRLRLAFFGVYRQFWGYCSCPTAWLVNFITAPAHPHATGVAVYTALFSSFPCKRRKPQKPRKFVWFSKIQLSLPPIFLLLFLFLSLFFSRFFSCSTLPFLSSTSVFVNFSFLLSSNLKPIFLCQG